MADQLGPARRQLGLLLHLVENPRGLTRDQLEARIADYSGADEASRKMVERDIDALRNVGVPVVERHDTRSGIVFAVDVQQWPLVDPKLTEAESQVVAIASSARFAERSLSRVGSQGWAKLAGARGREDLQNTDSAVVVADNSRLTGADLDAIIAARLRGQRIRFWYTPQVGDDDQERLLEPWRLFPRDGKLYLIGWDVHRQGPRTFRLSRMCEVTTSAEDVAVHGDPGEQQMRRLAQQALFGEFTGAPVVIDVEPGTCGDVVRGARDLGAGRWELPEMPVREATNMALEHAGNLVIIEPTALRERVVAELNAVIAAYKEHADG